ncbi:primosome subunit DnaD [Clostridium carboxidivorans P7]|uniref:Sec-independent protein translocase protein TatA n=1 Tax=Clostridium carboxidivorans P7 TaxID=536227 RepID=C6PWT6_9CLOT|nr:twin-arginine translocase TatA/TatE family subunit [Clostridium carboxidivorans]AKN31982.1 primosome subunit DnaD [Clostridium carboxidivorans P7]EET86311.1 twin-arginine translocation protein, TatA/E family subunit [Clostridium carboxidivorans P7]
MFEGIGMSELIVILIIALIVFGPSKLPEIGKSFGKAVSEFKNHANRISEDIDKEEHKK